MSANRSPLAYTNHLGDTYYLHEGTTKTGKPRYFVAKTKRDGVRASMPEGFEFVESINGVVSVSRVVTTPSLVPEADVNEVREAVGKHAHLARYKIELRKNEILIHEPSGGGLLPGLFRPNQQPDLARFAKILGIDEEKLRLPTAGTVALPIHYMPVMKFLPADFASPKTYRAFRMTYRGEGGWGELSAGPIAKLAAAYIHHLGRDSFFDLW